MNPHFIFNALNSIQDLILQQDTDASYDYIVMFAELVRNTLNYSNQDFISIEKELEFLKVYLQLEKLRFGDQFNFTIIFKEKESLEVPSLMIQPFIENALVHGLIHRKGKKELPLAPRLFPSRREYYLNIAKDSIYYLPLEEFSVKLQNQVEGFEGKNKEWEFDYFDAIIHIENASAARLLN